MLKFAPENHRYTWNGVEVPGVTQILGDCGLSDFSRVPPADLERAQRRGKAVHLACELYDKGKLNVDTLSPVIMPYLDGWIEFRKAFGGEITHIEQSWYSVRYKFAGTLDRVVRSHEKRPYDYIIDIKSGAAVKSTRIQTAGYKILRVENGELLGAHIKRMVVQLTSKGEFVIHPHKEHSVDERIFMSALSIYNFKRGA